MAASSIPKILENSLIVLLFVCFRVRSKFYRILLYFYFVSFGVIFLEFIVIQGNIFPVLMLEKSFLGAL